MLALALAPMLADGESNSGDVFIACLLLIVFVVIAAAATMWVRRWARRNDEVPAGGFTLGALRDLHKSGKITLEEFEKAKAMIIDAAKKASEKKAATVQRQDMHIP